MRNKPPEKSSPPLNVSYLESTIGYRIRRAQVAIFQDVYRCFGDYSITTAQFSVLAVVHDNPGANQADLAAALGVERPRMVPIIDSLEKRNLAYRREAPNDRRLRQIYLTKSGRELLASLKSSLAEHQKSILSKLNVEDPKIILDMLDQLTKAAK